MKLSINTVKNLIKELSSVIDYNLNIMDENGIIISSTNSTRIGQFHEGALLVIKNKLAELQVNYDGEYAGCKEGTNVPLIVDDKIIGVLGITGDVKETAKYTSIIKKTAEILLKDYFNLEQTASWNQARLFFLNSWLNQEITDRDRIHRKLQQYKCPLSSSWQVIVVDNLTGHEATRRFLDENVRTSHAVTSWNNTHGIIIGMFESVEYAGEYIETLMETHPEKDNFFFAIGNTVHDEMLVPKSYDQALALLQYARKKSQSTMTAYRGISLYRDNMMDIIFSSVPEEFKKEIITDVFSNCKESDIDSISAFIMEYCNHNGSINKIAESLYMHKNTVQYKINRIYRLTGLDLRVTNDMIKLRTAAQFHLIS